MEPCGGPNNFLLPEEECPRKNDADGLRKISTTDRRELRRRAIELCGTGRSHKDIATELGLSPRVVKRLCAEARNDRGLRAAAAAVPERRRAARSRANSPEVLAAMEQWLSTPWYKLADLLPDPTARRAAGGQEEYRAARKLWREYRACLAKLHADFCRDLRQDEELRSLKDDLAAWRDFRRKFMVSIFSSEWVPLRDLDTHYNDCSLEQRPRLAAKDADASEKIERLYVGRWEWQRRAAERYGARVAELRAAYRQHILDLLDPNEDGPPPPWLRTYLYEVDPWTRALLAPPRTHPAAITCGVGIAVPPGCRDITAALYGPSGLDYDPDTAAAYATRRGHGGGRARTAMTAAAYMAAAGQ